jgi:hypothetical protein
MQTLSPGPGEEAVLEDIAILTADQVISEDLGIKLENVTLDMLGRAKRVVIAPPPRMAAHARRPRSRLPAPGRP